ncbi:MAG: aminotransferase class I/II-fold pyridoxal phosphate-dependent enzyme [Anaerolineales bacterium]
MKALARNVSSIERSPVRVIFDQAAAYADAIHLEIGQPDFSPPPHVIEAACRAARDEYTGYTANAGMMCLREAVCAKLDRENDLHVTPDNIVVTIGAMQAVHASMSLLLEPGDEVLLPDPGYGNFSMAARLLHAVPRYYLTAQQRGFEPDFDQLESLVNERTKVLFLTSPSNPTGAVYSQEVLQRCMTFAQRHDLFVISDETYDRLVYEGQHFSPALWDEDGRCISIFTTSKTYAMTGWRVGYAAVPLWMAREMAKIQEPVVSCANTVAQVAATAALMGPQDCVETMRQEYKRRRDLAIAVALDNELPVSYPHGAFYMLADISAQPLDSLTFCQNLLQEAHVAVAPGIAFGAHSDGFVRISLCASADTIAAGIPLLAEYLHQTAR